MAGSLKIRKNRDIDHLMVVPRSSSQRTELLVVAISNGANKKKKRERDHHSQRIFSTFLLLNILSVRVCVCVFCCCAISPGDVRASADT
uniref:Uncharacterized protein n=1 Tax=Daphnia galeata TaxID=27404 RepID=A0A8J2WTM4_9CRUS|nr:unnamed protein product [Daphnia galeata]